MQNFSRSIVVADYLINMDRYKKDCVNKVRPQLHCNGKCQMKKKLEDQDRQEKPQSTSSKFIVADLVLSSKSFFPEVETLDEGDPKLFYSRNILLFSSYICDIFHPPAYSA